MEIPKKLQQEFTRAKIGLMETHNSVFIITILFSLKHSWTQEIPTAGTDGTRLLLNPDWFGNLSHKAKIGLLAHEAWHVAFNHMARTGNRDLALYNMAADYVINIMLKDNKYTLPDGGCVDAQYRGMSTNDVYDLLVQQGKKADGYTCDILPGNEKTKEEKEEKQRAIDDLIIKAATRAKMADEDIGKLPGDIQIMLGKLLNPKLDWRNIFQNYMSSFSKDDYTFTRPNKRFMPDYYLPSLHTESLGEICFAVDTSASVSELEFNQFLSEINFVKEQLKPAQTTILDFDTKIKNVHKLAADESISSVSFYGRGGTNLTPVFEYYNKTKPVVLVVFSDLICHAIKDDPGYPVIWVCVNNERATVNFGKLIHFSI